VISTKSLVKILFFVSFTLNSLLWSSLSFSEFIDSKQDGDIVYFLYTSPNKIMRYDLDSASFLNEIILPKAPTAFMPINDYIYIGYNRELRRLSTSSLTSEFFRNFSADIKHIAIVDNILQVIETSNTKSSLNTLDLSLIKTSSNSPGNSFIGSNINSFFYSDTGSYISQYSVYEPYQTNTNSNYSYANPDHLFLNTSESKIYDSSGTVYLANDLTYVESLAGDFDTITFLNDQPIVVRDNTLFMYDTKGLEQGRNLLTHSPQVIAAKNNQVTSFVATINGITPYKTEVSNIIPLKPSAVDPSGLNYQPDLIESDQDNNIYLVDNETLTIFNWQVDSQNYGPSWGLNETPNWMSFSSQHQRLYLGYPSGKITYFDTTLGEDAIEIHFTSLAQATKGLIAANDYLIAVDASGTRNRHYSFNKEGSIIETVTWRKNSDEYTWNPYTNYLHLVASNQILGSKINSTDGTFGNSINSDHLNSDINHNPLQINSDGSLIISGAGQIYDSNDLSLTNAIANNIDDAVWIGSLLATIKADSTTLQLWKDNYEPISETVISDASSLKLFSISNQLIIIKQSASGPVFVSFDLSTLPDVDDDGINDLADNCTAVANPLQEDFDQDNSGDICDMDDDNDLIPDATEISAGLNPLAKEDASEDLDSDGFNNLVEFMLATEMDNAESKPATVSQFNHDFTNGLPAGFYNLPKTTAWTIITSDDTQVLQSPGVSKRDDSTSLFFSADFNTGTLTFKSKAAGESYHYFDLELYIDGEPQQLNSNYSYWQNQTVVISAGIHTLEIRYSRAPRYSTATLGYLQITDFAFGPDQDGDGITDTIDNCPAVSNSSQYDSDDDGLGNDCDNDPYGYDTDGDGHTGYNDNCPNTYNPDQANIDNDSYGDACDDTDNRPSDADQDGHADYYDNCPNLSNPRQEDFDRDGLGNTCDTDSDNDLIPDNVENEYAFLDPLNPEDALLDFDNDGAINVYEISNGLDPEKPDNFSAINLIEYFPLGDIDYLYSYYGQYLNLTIAPTDATGQFSISYNDETVWIVERRSSGIYLVSVTSNNSEKIFLENYLLFPSTIKLGQLIDTSGIIYGENTRTREEINTQHYLKEVNEVIWKGDSYPAITLTENGYDVTYLKGIGPIKRSDLELESIDIKFLSASEASSSSGGGYFNLVYFLLLLTFLVTTRHRKIKSY
jgi:hypothetical protein